MSELSRKARAVQVALEAAGINAPVVELTASTRTAVEAAGALGCEVAQIAKSIVFRARDSGQGVLVIASGTNRIDEANIARELGEPLDKANAAFVRDITGYAIGGVPPCGHASPLTVFVDRELAAMDVIWAAAGTPHAVFRLRGSDLEKLTGGKIIAVC